MTGGDGSAAPDGGARVALVSARAARDLDDDLAPLLAAFARLGATAEVQDWDDPDVDWSSYDMALVRSTWDYHARYDEFRDWVDRVAAVTDLHNPVEVIAWNTDKRYLRELSEAGIPVVPTTFLNPEVLGPVRATWGGFRDAVSGSDGVVTARGAGDPLPAASGSDPVADALGARGEVVVKPSVSAGARNTARYVLDDAAQRSRAVEHVHSLLEAGRVVMVQPYLDSVDARGETAVVVIDGTVSHALRKGPLLRRGAEMDGALFAIEDMSSREATGDEVAVAASVVELLEVRFGRPPLYARVDLLAGQDGAPVLLELEMTEPSLFFEFAPEAADRFARAALARLS